MIKGFKSKETEKIFNRRFSKKLPQMILDRAEEKPAMLDAAVSLQDLNTPGNLRRSFPAIARGSTAFGSMIDGESASFGVRVTRTTSRSWITTAQKVDKQKGED